MPKDKRYTIAKEFNGSPTAQHVLRFCGDYISGHDTFEAAQSAMVLHNAARF